MQQQQQHNKMQWILGNEMKWETQENVMRTILNG